METKITFSSDGLKLSGIVHTPDDLRSGERRPAFIVLLHGFGGNKDGHGQSVVAKQFTQWGYVTMRIDFRGCGDSEGEHGRIICLDQVADTRNALTYLATRPEVDPERIGLVEAASARPWPCSAAARTGGGGDLLRRLGRRRAQVPRPASNTGGMEPLRQHVGGGKRHRERTGKSLMVPRYDIVPIPEHLRRNMSAGSIMEFPAETAQSMNDFRADDQVGNISPRPLLLLHSANDSVTPTYESIEMFKRARQPAELHLLSDVDHFTFNQENQRLTRIVSDWLERYFPVQKPR